MMQASSARARRTRAVISWGLLWLAGAGLAAAQQAINPRHQHRSYRQEERRRKRLEKELNGYYKKWLNQDVTYIITPAEREAFLKLRTNEERDQFIEAFWQRRNPDPDSPYNSFKEQYYRRIAYADAHFANGEPGWRTDRGRIWIMYGKPNEIDAHPDGGPWVRPQWMGGGTAETYPWVDWIYHYLPRIGTEVKLEFVDQCMCGDYKLTMDPCAKDALNEVPNGDPTMYEQMGLTSQMSRFTQTNGTTCSGTPGGFVPERDSEFSRLEQYAEIFRPPKIKFKDLESVINKNINYHLLPFQFRADYVKVTDDTVLVPFTIQIADRDMTFREKNGVQQSRINILGRISTLTGRTVQTFEHVVDLNIPQELLPQYLHQSARYWYGALLRPGRYKVDLALKDVNSPNKMGTLRRGIVVPQFSDHKLQSSTIMLADEIERVPSQDVGAGQFIIGNTKVMPVVGDHFRRSQSMGIYMQLYNLKVSQTTHKPSATIDWKILNAATHKLIFSHVEQAQQMSNAAEQMTLEKTLPLEGFSPGAYELQVQVTDNLDHQTISPQATFFVK